MNDQKYEEILSSMGLGYNNFSIKSLNENKVEILIRRKIIRVTDSNLQFMRNNYKTRTVYFAKINMVEYLKIFTEALLSQEEMKRRYVIRHLFIRPGLAVRQYQAHFGTDARKDFRLLEDWTKEGYIRMAGTEKEEYLTLTEKGLGLSDYLGPMLISGQIHGKMKEWEDIYDGKDDIIQG